MPPILADIQDILGAIVPVLFVIFWVISQVIGGINKARKGQAEPPQQFPPQKIPPSPEEDALAKEIERFLGQKREPTRPQEQLPRPGDAVITAEVTRPTPEITTEASTREPLMSTSADRSDRSGQRRESSRQKKVTPKFTPKGQSIGSTFAKQKRQTDGPQSSTTLPGNLPGNIPATSPMNLDGVQDVGIIDLPDSGATDVSPWQAMISDPTTLRQAFLLSQIFSRPEDRW